MRTLITRILAATLAIILLGGAVLIIASEVNPKHFVFDHSVRAAMAAVMLAGYFVYIALKPGRKQETG